MDQLVRRAGSAENRDRVRAGAKMPAALCVLVCGIALMVWTLLGDRIVLGWVDPRFGPAYSPLTTVLVLGRLGVAAVGVLLVALTVTRNRPKFLVPPYLRFDPGYIEVRRPRARGEDVDRMQQRITGGVRSRVRAASVSRRRNRGTAPTGHFAAQRQTPSRTSPSGRRATASYVVRCGVRPRRCRRRRRRVSRASGAAPRA
jgi:hypothetical protein